MCPGARDEDALLRACGLARWARRDEGLGGDLALLVMCPRSHGPVEDSDKLERASRLGPEERGAVGIGRPVRGDWEVVGDDMADRDVFKVAVVFSVLPVGVFQCCRRCE